MAGIRPFSIAVVLACACAAQAFAADQRTTVLNRNALGLLAAETQWLPDALEIADAVQHEDKLRVIPMVGIGAVQAVNDIAFLQSVDAALLPADSITYARLQGLMQGLDDKIAYVARLSQIELVLVARHDIADVAALKNKRIATGPAHTAAFASGELLFGMMDIPFLRVPRQGSAGIQALVRGQADAALVTVRDVVEANLSREAYHVISISIPVGLEDTYTPAILTSDDLPALLGAREAAETISTSLAIAVFNWPTKSEHYGKIQRFASALYGASDQISAGGDEPINLSAIIPGLRRHASATEILGRPGSQNTSETTTLTQGDEQ